MDQIISNFYILIPIAVVIALRIIDARKKAAAQGAAPPEAAPRGTAQERAAPRREAPAKRGPPSALRTEARADARASVRAGPALPAVEAGTPPPVAAPQSAVPVAAREAGREGLPGALGRLSPMQRAVALSEILGKPRGLEPYQGSV